jgi:hypothetical protein
MAKKATAKSVTPPAPARKNPLAVAAGLILPPAQNVDSVPSVYINNMEMLSMNSIDVRIAFNEVVTESGPSGGGVPTLSRIRRASIVMSPQHFIAMLQMLNLNAQSLMAGQQDEAALMQKHVAEAIERAKTQALAAQQTK